MGTTDTTQNEGALQFEIALNPSTIKGYGLGIREQIDVAAEAGYDGIEPWVRDLEAYVSEGGDLSELRRRCEDGGLAVVDGIAFFRWAHADGAIRRQGLEDARRQMALIAGIGGACIAAPPWGEVDDLALDDIAEFYSELLAVGQQMGVLPLLELWGHAPRLSRLSEVLYVAAACGSRDCRLLLDVYHLYKGGNAFESLAMINGPAIGLVHVNDYPGTPERDEIADKDRVWPGDGTAPMRDILSTLRAIGYTGALSVELFNPAYWQGTPLATAKTGLEKTRRLL